MTENTLASLRDQAADVVWDAYDMGDAKVEDFDGWSSQRPGTEQTRVVYFESLEPDGPTDMGHFTVVFASETSAEVVDAYARIGGNDIGNRGDTQPSLPHL